MSQSVPQKAYVKIVLNERIVGYVESENFPAFFQEWITSFESCKECPVRSQCASSKGRRVIRKYSDVYVVGGTILQSKIPAIELIENPIEPLIVMHFKL